MEEKKLIEFRNIVKSFDSQVVLKGINLDIYENEFVTLLGPSGCGKTTLLRILGGFLDADEGKVIFDNEDITGKPPYERELNTVFQKYALFPHLSVYENIAFGLKLKKMSKDIIDQKVMKMLKLIGLEGYEDKNTTLLSGGQQQRVAIARALVNEPKVLLLDEPLAALDLKLRKEMQYELKRIQQEVGITFIFVTHDQEEALTMSDRIAIINQGVLEQVDTAFDIYEHPKTRFVAGFIGESNIFDAVVISQDGDTVTVGTEVGKAQASGFTGELAAGTAVSVSVRPENMLYSRERVEGFHIKGVVKEHIYVGNLIKTIVLLNDGTEVKINRFSMDDLPKEGEMIYLYWHLEKGIVLPEKNLVDTDASRDIEGGDEDEEE
mgnify:CR=1 FL=1